MPIHAPQNLYPGVNAHLNSFLQQEGGGWESFHAEHIIDLRRVLAPALPEGYYAVAEKSLQITPTAWFTATSRPDITVLQQRRGLQSAVAPAQGASPTGVFPLGALLPDAEDDLVGIMIYQQKAGKLPGKPITRIELLSPTNKPPHADHRAYAAKRQQTLQSGISLVEIDYLHQSPPASPLVRDYSGGQLESFPYNITVDIPQPTPADGRVEHYGVAVDAPLPIINVPLVEGQNAPLDLQVAYEQTFASGGFFDITVDYADDPPHLDRYQPQDQERIHALLKAIRAANS
jgi:hypothetical protein